jgi:hypothetical protein
LFVTRIAYNAGVFSDINVISDFHSEFQTIAMLFNFKRMGKRVYHLALFIYDVAMLLLYILHHITSQSSMPFEALFNGLHSCVPALPSHWFADSV